MDFFNLEDYACPHNSLPEILWKVTHPNSQHRLHPGTGEILSRTMRDDMISDEASLKQSASHHFDWYSTEPSCFLSVFTDEKHARNWARGRLWEPDDDVYITRIITAMLPATAQVFNATSLCVRLDIAHKYSKHELMFLHRIPWQSLGRTRRLEGTPTDDLQFVVVKSLWNLNDTYADFITWVIDEKQVLIARACGHQKTEEILIERIKDFGSGFRENLSTRMIWEFEKIEDELGHGSFWDTQASPTDSSCVVSDILAEKREEEERLKVAAEGAWSLLGHSKGDEEQFECEATGKEGATDIPGKADEDIPDLSRLALEDD